MNKKTLVIGASEKTERYSNKAIRMLRKYNHDVVAVGNKEGIVEEIPIEKNFTHAKDIHTVTLYLNAQAQKMYYEDILKLKPKRIIFNPGAENEELNSMALSHNINTMEACTLVLLSTGQY